MKRYRFLSSVAVVAITVLSTALFLAPVNAQATFTPYKFIDNFSTLPLQPDPEAYWWVLNWGDNWFNEGYYGDASSVTQVSEPNVNYVDLALFPDATPGFYTNAEVAEYYTGFSYGVPGKWSPEVGSPIEVRAQVRWVGDFNQDGSGNAIGTSGIWLWNSPADFINMEFHPVNAFGFSWNNDNSVLAQGLTALAMQENMPVAMDAPSFPVDVQNWVDLKMEWSVDAAGQQSVAYWVNGTYLSTQVLPVPFENGLSLEIWQDNQTYGWEGVTFENPSEEQSFQVNFIHVTQK